MATDKISNHRSTAGKRQAANTYSSRTESYEHSTSIITSDRVSAEDYRMFVSESGGKAGTYTITAGQDTYRELNRSFAEKGRRR